jgi:hypothetical protein
MILTLNGELVMKKICVVLISLLFTKCVSPVKENPYIVSINSVIAECGGRSVLEKNENN